MHRETGIALILFGVVLLALGIYIYVLGSGGTPIFLIIQEICNSSLGQLTQLIANSDLQCSRVDVEAAAFGISIDLGYVLMALGPITAIVGALNVRGNHVEVDY